MVTHDRELRRTRVSHLRSKGDDDRALGPIGETAEALENTNGGEGSMSGKANLQGRVIGGLIVSESAGNHRWNIQCDKCGARGTESHAALVSGMARCKASGCRDNAEAVRAAQSETLPKARRKAITDEANERQSAEDRAEAERAAIEAQWADGHDQLAKLIRERIATQRDDECWIEPATLALSMRQADADNFNRTEAAKYAESNPSFFPSRANREALGGYFDRNGIAIVSSATLAAAVRRLSEYGLLESRPAPAPPALPQQPYINLSIEPEPDAEPDGLGWDIETGEPRVYSPLQIERMSSETYRRAFRVRREEQILNRRRW